MASSLQAIQAKQISSNVRKGLLTSRIFLRSNTKKKLLISSATKSTISSVPYRPNQFRLREHIAGPDTATQRGNIKIVVRVRSIEPIPGRRLIVQPVDEHLIIFDPLEEEQSFYFHGEKQKPNPAGLNKQNKDKKFVFDHVYGPEHTNLVIFEEAIKPTIDSILSGINCSVFAYGATGSGKTYTMLGSNAETNPGLTFLTVMELYNRLSAMQNDYESEIQVSYVEVYNEDIKDLLRPTRETSSHLIIREDGHGGTTIPDLIYHKPENSQKLFELLHHGNSIRSQHPTDQNAESSRSHAILQVYVKLRNRFTNMLSNTKSSKLVMIDLAGSERGMATGYTGQRFREGSAINKSLLSLGNCINALADGKKHIPYRDSKLTRILKDSLGGNCKTVMIANVSPADTAYNETFNTLRYADRAKRIQFSISKNVLTVHARIAEYNVVVNEMSTQITSLKQKLQEYEERDSNKNTSKVDAETQTEHRTWII